MNMDASKPVRITKQRRCESHCTRYHLYQGKQARQAEQARKASSRADGQMGQMDRYIDGPYQKGECVRVKC